MLFLMIEIDHGNSASDESGHAAGDLVLVQMREGLKNFARATGLTTRCGGKEFLIVARATSRLEAPLLPERLQGGRDGWVGIYGTAVSDPGNLFQCITQQFEAARAGSQLHVISSADRMGQTPDPKVASGRNDHR